MAGLRSKSRTDSGIILIVILWILVILSLLVVGLSQRSRIEVALTRFSVGKLQSKYAALAGLMYVMDQIQQDSANEKTLKTDNYYRMGITRNEDLSLEDLFENVAVGENVFHVRYTQQEEGNPPRVVYGLRDEERRININTLTQQNYQILKYLIVDRGFEENTAEIIASSVIDWIDQDQYLFNDLNGAEEDYYLGKGAGYSCKNAPFDSLQELMLVRGMTKEIFAALEPYITVFPRSGRFLVNLETASPPVLSALMRSASGAKTNTSQDDADSLVEKILQYRRGADDIEGTSDDRSPEINELVLNGKEKVIFLLTAPNWTKVSHFLRATVEGVDTATGTSSVIEAVIHREDMSIVYWRRY
jgi:general secretion pathway protein K